MAQYFEVLSQGGEKTAEQPFYNNVEDQPVQYLISPDKTQTQYPTNQIVVTSGDQLMVVDGQQQQIVIDQTPATYQGQQIQVQVQQPVQVQQQLQIQQPIQVQTQQFAVIQDGVNNDSQQIFYMETNSNERLVVEQSGLPQSQSSQQPIVLNHQISQNNSTPRTQPGKGSPAQLQQQIRGAVRQPVVQQPRPQNRQMSSRPLATAVQQIRQQNPSQPPQVRPPNPAQLRVPNPSLLKQPNLQQQLRQQAPNAPINRPANQTQQLKPQNSNQAPVRQPNPSQIRPANPSQQNQVRQRTAGTQQLQKSQGTVNARFPGLAQIQQRLTGQAQLELDDMEIKSSDEQEPVSLPDGSVISMAVYKKMLVDQKARTTLQQRTNTTPQQNNTPTTPATSTPVSSTNKRRNPTSRANSRQTPKAGAGVAAAVTTAGAASIRAVGRGRTITQFPAPQQRPQQPNDPSRYAMMAQQPSLTKPQQQSQFQNQLQSQMLQQQRQQQLRQSQANYIIQPPKANQKPQQQRPLPSYIPSTQIQKIIESTPVGEEFSDSIRMLVLLENGEQRLITFTLPKEACTIQEILEQVNVPFRSDTNIQVTEANTNGINYIVTVGNVPNFGYEEEGTQMQEESPLSQPPPLTPVSAQSAQPQTEQLPPCPTLSPQVMSEPSNASTPEPQKEIPKFVSGMLALCAACGYLSEDFSKCIRCGRKLPDNVKAIPATIRAATNGQKKEITVHHSQPQVKSPGVPNPAKSPATSPKKRPTRSKNVEHESVVISSDEEEEDKPAKVNENILQKLGSSITISPVTKEPSTNDIQRHSVAKPKIPIGPDQEADQFVSTTIKCRTIRIGSYRFVPPEKVLVDSQQVVMKVPHPSKEHEVKTIKVDQCEIVKVLASFNKALPVFFYYLNPALAKVIREELDMTPEGDYYYDPLSSKEEAYRRITLLPDDVSDEDRDNFQLIYGCAPGILDELNVKEANDILIKTCPKELTKAALGIGSFTEIKQLLTYPPEGRGRISINTEDYVCLAQDQFLNDVIIDFYLKYLVENLPPEQKPKVHIFSTFFYKRLTTKPTKASRKSQPAELDPTLTAAQKRHARVKTWTKNVNLFEKDFIIVPINENAHWFLAIICYPGMDGCHTWDGKPYKLEVQSKKKKKTTVAASLGNVPIAAVKQEKIEKPIICEDPEASDKDEAEGDDSELDSDDSEEQSLSQPVQPPVTVPLPAPPPQLTARQARELRPPIKQSCILIFDSLAGASRSRVVATLRDYLTCEYKTKLGKERIYNKDIIKGACPKVPQQNNFTDCGLYLLQYVEQFFLDPIKDYHIPISQIKNWFEEIVVTRKREEIAELIKNLMKEYGKDVRILPDISFPTVNGKLVEPDDEEEEEMMDEEEFGIDEEHHELKDDSGTSFADMSGIDSFGDTSATEDSKEEDSPSPMKPSSDNICCDFVSQAVSNVKPDISEFSRQSNRDTMSYLKAKRIIRHKNSDGPEVKKMKGDHMQ